MGTRLPGGDAPCSPEAEELASSTVCQSPNPVPTVSRPVAMEGAIGASGRWARGGTRAVPADPVSFSTDSKSARQKSAG